MGIGTHEALGCSSRAAQRMRAAVLPCSTAGRAPVVTGMGGRWPQMAGQGLSLAPACAFDCCAAPPADRLLLGRLAELLLLLPDCGAMKQRLLEQLLPSPSWKSPMPSIFSPEPERTVFNGFPGSDGCCAIGLHCEARGRMGSIAGRSGCESESSRGGAGDSGRQLGAQAARTEKFKVGLGFRQGRRSPRDQQRSALLCLCAEEQHGTPLRSRLRS